MIQATKSDTMSISAKGRIVIPEWLRRKYGIEEGTRVHLSATSEGILLKPITRAYIRSLRGSLKGKGVMKALKEDRKREWEL